MMNTAWTDDGIISKLRQDFSSMSTMNRAREELKDLKQLPGQPISSYMYKYGSDRYRVPEYSLIQC